MILIKFVGVGLVVTAVHVSIYSFLSTTQLTSPQWANIVAFLCSFTLSYLGQRHVTFAKSEVKSEKRVLMKFIVSTALSFLLNVFWVHLTSEILKVDPNFAIIGMVILTPAFTFVTQKLWVFK